jgi:hypothetical protein
LTQIPGDESNVPWVGLAHDARLQTAMGSSALRGAGVILNEAAPPHLRLHSSGIAREFRPPRHRPRRGSVPRPGTIPEASVALLVAPPDGRGLAQTSAATHWHPAPEADACATRSSGRGSSPTPAGAGPHAGARSPPWEA